MNTEKKKRHFFTLAWIPNSLSLLNLFSGFFAILRISEGRLVEAAWFIAFALFCDSIDGNVARIFKVSSDFGRELDSLSDIVSFVVAPAFLTLKSLSYHFAPWTLYGALFYLACGAYRLARFNLLPPVKNYFRGLPTPAAAIMIVMTIAGFEKHGWMDISLFTFISLLLMVVTGFLMISQVPYPKITTVPLEKWGMPFYISLILFPLLLFAVNLEIAIAALFMIFVFFSPPQYLYVLHAEEGLVTKA